MNQRATGPSKRFFFDSANVCLALLGAKNIERVKNEKSLSSLRSLRSLEVEVAGGRKGDLGQKGKEKACLLLLTPPTGTGIAFKLPSNQIRMSF